MQEAAIPKTVASEHLRALPVENGPTIVHRPNEIFATKAIEHWGAPSQHSMARARSFLPLLQSGLPTASPARTALKISQLTDGGMPPTYDSMH
jgi:hypothetical protein